MFLNLSLICVIIDETHLYIYELNYYVHIYWEKGISCPVPGNKLVQSGMSKEINR